MQDLIYLTPKQPIVIRFHVRVDDQPLSEFEKSAAKGLFDSLDSDKNGVLEGKELTKLPSPEMVTAAAGQAGGSSGHVAPLIPEPSSKNGTKTGKSPAKARVTLDELAAFVRACRGAPSFLTSTKRTIRSR